MVGVVGWLSTDMEAEGYQQWPQKVGDFRIVWAHVQGQDSQAGLTRPAHQDGEENFFPWFFREMLFPGAEGRKRGSPLLSQKHPTGCSTLEKQDLCSIID